MTDGGSQTNFNVDTDGAWHTQTGIIHNATCMGNTNIVISGGWGHPCTFQGIPHPGTTCLSTSYGAPPLPVELVDFKANKIGNHIELNWSTASEIDNDRFIIEHSNNGLDF